MKQATLNLNLTVKKTRKREFLEQMGQVVPWAALVGLIAPYYPEGLTGRVAQYSTGADKLRNKPAGTIRITTTDFAADTVLWPRLKSVLAEYPDIKIEMNVDYALADIVAQKFDIGVRWGDQVAKDMVAVRVGPDMRMGIVGSAAYLNSRSVPKNPKELTQHNCITLRLPTRGEIYAWELKKGKREVQVRVDGQLTCNGVYQMLNAAIDGAGLAFIPEYLAEPHVAAGRLQWVLEDWCPTFPGLHIYYPSRREHSRAFALVVEALRYRA